MLSKMYLAGSIVLENSKAVARPSMSLRYAGVEPDRLSVGRLLYHEAQVEEPNGEEGPPKRWARPSSTLRKCGNAIGPDPPGRQSGLDMAYQN